MQDLPLDIHSRSASGSSALTIHDLVHDHAMYDSRHDTHDAGQGQHQQQLLPASAAPSQPWYPGAIGSIPRAGPPAHYLPRHSRYESTDSSIYESSWFSDSPSILSPTSPEAGYYSAGDASDFSANPGIWSPRSSIGYPMSGPVFRPQASLTLDPSRLSALHLSSTASQAPPPAAAEKEETEEDAVGEVEEMSGDDSEYVESKRVAPRKKGKRLMKLEDDTPEIESDFADPRAMSGGRSARIRASRLHSERKRRDAMSIAFAELRSMMPPEVQKLTKSQVLGEVVLALPSATDEAAHYRQLCQVLQHRLAALEAGGQPERAPDVRQEGSAPGPSRQPTA